MPGINERNITMKHKKKAVTNISIATPDPAHLHMLQLFSMFGMLAMAQTMMSDIPQSQTSKDTYIGISDSRSLR